MGKGRVGVVEDFLDCNQLCVNFPRDSTKLTIDGLLERLDNAR